jgi:hypothetical protein
MKKINLSFFALVCWACSVAQVKPYDVASLPEPLKQNASSVTREEKIVFEVKSISKASLTVHKVVTVLDERGKDELVFQEYTDRFRSLESASIHSFDSKGNALNKYRRNDLSTQTAGEGLVPDGKVYYLELPPPVYPMTIMIDYAMSFNGLLNYPDYQVQLPEQSVENSSFVATVPVELGLRFKAKNTRLEPVIAEDGKFRTYTWTVKNVPALEYEAGTVSNESRYPCILLSPNKFELDGYAGDMSTWQSFGRWYGSLAKGTDNLSSERIKFFQSMVKDETNDREKVKMIYSYLQENCRYVLIALGIGGFKPFEADFVDKKKYGDCKALSNYTQACLNAIGIKSYQALINASYNKEPVDPEFPHNGFNHVILCVPLAKDSIWLECTSNITGFGELGNFTENRNALLITEDGGKLVPTPRSKAAENTSSSFTTIALAADGSGTANVVMETTGEYKQDLVNYVSNQKKDDQKRYLVDAFGYMQPDDFEINYDQVNKRSPTTISITMGKVPEFTAGKKLFLNPRLYKIWSHSLPKAENRTQDFYFQHPFIKKDTTVYQLPPELGMETLPRQKNIKFEFGSFDCNYTYDAAKNTIMSVASLQLNEYKIPAAKFLATKTFFNHVLAEYTEKIVIKRL